MGARKCQDEYEDKPHVAERVEENKILPSALIAGRGHRKAPTRQAKRKPDSRVCHRVRALYPMC